MKWVRRVAIVVVVLGVLFGLTRWYTESRWSATQARVKQKIAALDQRDRARPVLWGQASPGESSVDYEAAVLALDDPQLRTDLEAAVKALRRAATEDEASGSRVDGQAERARLIDETAGALRSLRAGAHRDLGGRFVGGVGSPSETPSVLGIRGLGAAIILRAAHLLESGQDLKGVHTLLDGVQCGLDLAADPVLIMAMVSSLVRIRPTAHLFFSPRWDGAPLTRPPFRLQDLSPEALETLAVGLARSESPVLTLATRAEIEAVLMFSVLRQAGTEGLGGMGAGHFMDWVLSSRSMVANACELSLDAAAKFPPEDTPWHVAQPKLKAMGADLRERINPLMNLVATDWSSIGETLRAMQAKLGLLRLAVADVRGKNPALADPFAPSRMLQLRVESDRTVYWSVGADGADDAGNPTLDLVLVRIH